MARTVLAKGTLYRSDRSESVYIITAGVASATLVPTQIELDAATTYDVTGAISSVTGFETSTSSTTVKIMGSTAFPVKLSGPPEVADSMITFLADRLGVDIKSILTKDSVVHVFFAPNGDTATSYGECWAATVANLSRPKNFGGEEARVNVTFDPSAANERVLIPA